jgi:hypothetical protein
MIGSWASNTADLITYFRAKSLPVYDELAEALEAMADEETVTTMVLAVHSLLEVNARSQSFLADMTKAEMDFAKSTVMGERQVEIPGRYIYSSRRISETGTSCTTGTKNACRLRGGDVHVRKCNPKAVTPYKTGTCSLDIGDSHPESIINAFSICTMRSRYVKSNDISHTSSGCYGSPRGLFSPRHK